MKAILEEESRQNWKKMMEYTSSQYPPHFSPFGLGFLLSTSTYTLTFICIAFYLLLKN
jgi:hypothetical protein